MSADKPATKIIFSKNISPLTRADMSLPKGMQKKVQQKTDYSTPPPKENVLESTNTESFKDGILSSVTKEERQKETPKQEPLIKEIKQKKQMPKKERKPEIVEDLEELDNVIDNVEDDGDNVEDDLNFLSSKTKKEAKKLEEKTDSKIKEEIFEVEDVPKDYYKELERKIEKNQVILDFRKKVESCYLTDEINVFESSANIFLREVKSTSETYKDILYAHNHNASGICIASPFKFFTKPDFVAIFQKAFLGMIFDLSYSTPYYYTQAGTHHIYLSSQIIEKCNMLHVVLLDLLPRKAQLYDKRNVLASADFVNFTLYRAILVSANALFL